MTIKSLSLITATLLLTTNANADETLEPITIVSTSKTTQSIKNTTSNVTVITAEDIEEKGYQTVAQAINTVAGISISQNGGLGQPTSIFTRGMSSGKTLVLLDGMRLNDPTTTEGQARIAHLSTNNIAQIEIIKGGASSIWGSNASAGVINIITKEAKKGVHGSLALSYGSYNTKGTDADLSYKDEKITAQVLASYLKTDGFSALAPRSAEDDGYENKNYNIKLGYAFDENNKLNLSYNRIKTDVDYDTGIADDNLSNTTTDQTNYLLGYQLSIDNYHLDFKASKGEYNRDDTSSIYGKSDFDAKLQEYTLLNRLDYQNNKLIFGLEYKEIDGTSTYADASYKNKAVFLSNTYNINENTLLETNLRYDDFDTFEDKATYKIGLKHNHNFLEGFTTSANYYTSYDSPSSYQLANQLSPDVLLKPAYTKGYDISASYKEVFSISYFNTKVEDGIDWISLYDSEGKYIGGGYTNIEGKQKFSGMEIQSSYALSSLNINLSANYTHLFTYEDEYGTDLIRRAKDTFNAALDYYTDTNTHFGIDAQYIGNRKDLDYSTYQEVSTGNYTVWNLNFGTKIMNDIDLSIHAKNIFDKDYQSVYGYATEGQSIYAKIKYSF